MSLTMRLEIGGTQRYALRSEGIQIIDRVEQVGELTLTCYDGSESWRPERLQSIELWEPCTVVTDGAILSGSTSFSSASLTGAERHVRIPGAGPGGSTLRASITSQIFGMGGYAAVLDVAASETVSGATCLIGTCRFFGLINDYGESRMADKKTSRKFAITGNSLFNQLSSCYPITVRPSETLYDRLTNLISDTLMTNFDIQVYWPQIAVSRITEDSNARITEDGETRAIEDFDEGSTLVAKTYTGEKSFKDILSDLATEDGSNRSFRIDMLGRLRMDLPSGTSTPISILDTHQINPEGVEKKYESVDYYNQVLYVYGPTLTSYVIVDNTTEQQALGSVSRPKIITARFEDDEDITSDVATARAQALLDENSTRTKYVASGIRFNDQEGFESGQFGSFTNTERNLSGTHLVQDVTSEWIGTDRVKWQYTLTIINGNLRSTNEIDFWNN